ncbi:MAG TPA: GNAT family N-acetyltransferase [Candidatus Limnocylindrales bacterium]|nr:GNAT family N-acetyltransferase [Candidatus Limnocylindrales bacterium]
MTADEFEVSDVPDAHRFEARLRGQRIGYSKYVIRDDAIALIHTEIDPSVEGQGYGSRLAKAVLDDVTGRDIRVVVHCPFIGAYVRRHPADYPGVELRG